MLPFARENDRCFFQFSFSEGANAPVNFMIDSIGRLRNDYVQSLENRKQCLY